METWYSYIPPKTWCASIVHSSIVGISLGPRPYTGSDICAEGGLGTRLKLVFDRSLNMLWICTVGYSLSFILPYINGTARGGSTTHWSDTWQHQCLVWSLVWNGVHLPWVLRAEVCSSYCLVCGHSAWWGPCGRGERGKGGGRALENPASSSTWLSYWQGDIRKGTIKCKLPGIC